MASSVESPPADVPERTRAALTRALDAADLAAATSCFARDACFLTPDATVIHGREEIRPILAQMIARGTQVDVLCSSVLIAGEVALVSERWRISSAGAEGSVFEQSASPKMVLRRVEGDWKLSIAALWGLRERALQSNGAHLLG